MLTMNGSRGVLIFSGKSVRKRISVVTVVVVVSASFV